MASSVKVLLGAENLHITTTEGTGRGGLAVTVQGSYEHSNLASCL